MGRRVLVVGGGGREHALAWKLASSPEVETVLVAPGNDGMTAVATCLEAAGVSAWVEAARAQEVDLVVVGPEAPLVAGLADRLRDGGVRVLGPSAAAARLEGDKPFAKAFLEEAGVPTPKARVFDAATAALDWLDAHPGPCVVKAAGLAAGKGVVVCEETTEAREAVRRMLVEGDFGDAGRRVLLEERLVGRELSLLALLDGKRVCWFAPSRDHKRLRDGDAGPNTGGMGAFTPVPDVTPETMDAIVSRVLEPTVEHLGRRRLEYRGLLYLGLMLTEDGPAVLEYNCRFGDPETQVVLPAFADDLYPLLEGAAAGDLPCEGPLPLRDACVGVVLASAGYPGAPVAGQPIPGLGRLGDDDLVFHAGTRRQDGEWRTAGGRVLCAVGRAPTLEQARERAYGLARRLEFEGAQLRGDIALEGGVA